MPVVNNPLLKKEFRQRMRTNRAPVVLTGYLVSMVLLTFFLLYENVQGQFVLFQPSRSEQVFVTLSLLQMTVAAFLTPAFAGSSISGERERRTLAKMLTTTLSPLEILAGKVLSSSALLILLLVITLPLYSLVFLFGGAVPQEVLAVFGFQLLAIVLIASLSVMWSTLLLRSGWSTVMSYATVVWMTVFSGVIGYGLQMVYKLYPIEFFASTWGQWLLSLNPLWIEASLENYVQAAPHAWLIFIAFYSLLLIVLTVASVWRLRPQSLRFLPRKMRGEEGDYQ